MKLHLSSFCLFARFSYAALLTVPAWNGTYGVGTAVMVLTDTTRMDPFAPKSEHRSVVVSSYYPVGERHACDWTPHKYMPDKAAAVASKIISQQLGFEVNFASARLQICHVKDPDPSFGKINFPLVLFSPGDSSSRLWHGAQAQAIASLGYVVVTIDHPYDALVVEYPDGHVVLGTNRAPEIPLQNKRIITRVKDISFVLDELSKPAVVMKLVPNRHPSNLLKTTHVPMYGHSAGGGAAGYAMQVGEDRIAGTLNMDGTTPAAQRPLKIDIEQPYMLMQAERQPEWPGLWPRLNWALWVKLAKSHHGTFVDFPILVHLLGLEPVSHDVAHVIGSLPGDRVMEIINTYVHAFLQFVLNGKEGELLEKESEQFPDVTIVRSNQS